MKEYLYYFLFITKSFNKWHCPFCNKKNFQDYWFNNIIFDGHLMQCLECNLILGIPYHPKLFGFKCFFNGQETSFKKLHKLNKIKGFV